MPASCRKFTGASTACRTSRCTAGSRNLRRARCPGWSLQGRNENPFERQQRAGVEAVCEHAVQHAATVGAQAGVLQRPADQRPYRPCPSDSASRLARTRVARRLESCWWPGLSCPRAGAGRSHRRQQRIQTFEIFIDEPSTRAVPIGHVPSRCAERQVRSPTSTTAAPRARRLPHETRAGPIQSAARAMPARCCAA